LFSRFIYSFIRSLYSRFIVFFIHSLGACGRGKEDRQQRRSLGGAGLWKGRQKRATDAIERVNEWVDEWWEFSLLYVRVDIDVSVGGEQCAPPIGVCVCIGSCDATHTRRPLAFG
jgi:hypothetical protein